MKKPTIEEISQYCRSRGNGIDAEMFWDYYESVGWMRGKGHMKSWQATVRTWEKNQHRAAAYRPSSSREASNHADVMEDANRKSLQPRPGETWEQFSLRVWRTR